MTVGALRVIGDIAIRAMVITGARDITIKALMTVGALRIIGAITIVAMVITGAIGVAVALPIRATLNLKCRIETWR